MKRQATFLFLLLALALVATPVWAAKSGYLAIEDSNRIDLQDQEVPADLLPLDALKDRLILAGGSGNGGGNGGGSGGCDGGGNSDGNGGGGNGDGDGNGPGPQAQVQHQNQYQHQGQQDLQQQHQQRHHNQHRYGQDP